MTKLTNMNIPNSIKHGGEGMYFCKTCKEFVPSKEKHNKKKHEKFKR